MLNNFKVLFSNSHLIPFFMILFILLVYFTKFAYKKISIADNKIKKSLIICRIIIWALIVLSLINPLIQYYFYKTQKSKIAVILDNSISMMIKNKEGTTRFEKSKKILENKLFTKLSKNFNLQYFLFDKELTPIDKNSIIKTSQPDGNITDLGKALLKLSYSGGKGLDNIILLSDGINNVYHDMYRIANQLKNKGIKLYSFKLDNNEFIKDISLFEIEHPTEVNINTPFTIKTKINSINYNNKILIKTFINDNPVGSRKINIRKGFNIFSTSMSIRKIGVSKITISCEKQPGESILLNNSKSIFVRGIKNKFKVLLIYGQPSFEYKFLKLALDTDPNIIADTYLKIGNNLNRIKSIMKYDLIIIGNIKAINIPSSLMNSIVSYANNKSGSLLFLGGRHGFKNGNYHNSKLKNIIPVKWNNAGDIVKSDFTIKLTSSGLSSTAIQITDDVNKLQEYWNNLPPCNIINVVKKVKKGTDIFALNSKSPGLIVMAIGKHKRTRVGIFTAYPSWKWGFINIGMGYPQNPFNIFWQQYIRFLINMNAEKINLTTNKLIYKKNEDIFITLSLFNNNFKPIKRSKVPVELLKKKDKKYYVINTIDLYPSSSTEGYYKSLINLKMYGEYKLKSKIPSFKAETSFLIRKPDEELYKLKADSKLLNELSKITKGKFYHTPSEADELEKLLKGKETKREVKREINLWPNWLLLIAIIGLLTFEWYTRKKNGLS